MQLHHVAAAAAALIKCAFASHLVDEYAASCQGYAATRINETSRGLEAELHLIGKGCGVYSPDIPALRLTVEHQSESRLHVLIEDLEQRRYQIPEDVFPRPQADPDVTSLASDLTFEFTQEPFTFKVLRKSTGEALFDTSGTTLVFERQFLRLKTWLPHDPNLYGLGEHTDPFRLINKGYKRTFWARDAGAVPHKSNLYGDHPIYVDHRISGTHGVFLATSNGMDVVLDQDESGNNYLEYLAIGGVLDLYFLAGPGPTDVSQQYAEVVGTPAMIPYWSLGFHQCKYGYQDWFEVADVVHNYSIAEIPLETIWTDIDYMDGRRVFSVDPDRFPPQKMRDLMKYLRGRNQHYVAMVDPAVAESNYDAYNRGIEMGVFLSKNDSTPFRGVVWPGVTVFPDWFHPNATEYWTEMFAKTFNSETGVDIDGVWIDMNEPANFCGFPCDDPDRRARGLPPRPPPLREPPRQIPGFPSGHHKAIHDDTSKRAVGSDQERLGNPNLQHSMDEIVHVNIDHEGDDLLRPPYRIANHVSSGDLSDHTVYTDLQHANGQWTYDTHNLYGMLMGTATRAAMLNRRPNLRPLIITRSTFAGSGRYTGKWLGDNVSRWDHYRVQIAQMLSFASIFQIPMVGSDVCGFLSSAKEKMCARWATLGAFNPFYRNHADDRSPHQEFYLWPLVARAARHAIDIRYRLLDYLYTALARQSADGTPTLNPMWYIYPQDEQTFPIDLQFFYGDCILVSPVTKDDSTDVSIYLPDDQFYDFVTRKPVRGRGEWVDLKGIPFDRIPLHVRGGCIVPLRAESANTTTELRKKEFEILVAPGLDGVARGSLYVDDGETLDGGSHKAQVEFEYSAEEGLKTQIIPLSSSRPDLSLAEAGVKIAKITVLGEEPEGDDSDWDEL